jgi:hypothetical protein
MANLTGTINQKREQKTVIREDLYIRYEVVSSANGVVGEVFVPKATAASFATSETCTLTLA